MRARVSPRGGVFAFYSLRGMSYLGDLVIHTFVYRIVSIYGSAAVFPGPLSGKNDPKLSSRDELFGASAAAYRTNLYARGTAITTVPCAVVYWYYKRSPITLICKRA